MSALSLHTRRARLLAVRDQIDANGGGALQLHGGSMPAGPHVAAVSPLASLALGATSFTLHATDASMSLLVVGNAGTSGQVTWARYVDGAGAGVYDCTAGSPGSGAQMIVDDGGDPPSAQVYAGGEITVEHTVTEP